MEIIEQNANLIASTKNAENIIEAAGRLCYNSNLSTTREGMHSFIRGLISKGHESVIEHAIVSVLFTTNRGVTHELVRHRLASYSQESTRYVDYKKNVQFILPVWSKHIKPGVYNEPIKIRIDNSSDKDFLDQRADDNFINACIYAEHNYKVLRAHGWPPEKAREVLPNALATKIAVTANFREWRHIFKLRTSKKAHPQIRELFKPVLVEFQSLWPSVFGDLS